jgi:aspartate aminotransferase
MLETLDETVDTAPYEHKRNVLCDALEAIGYEVRRPEGSFYIFLKTPIPDDIAFTELLLKEGVLAVPGTGFGRSGYIRLSLTIPLERIQKSTGGFERAFLCSARQEAGLQTRAI